MEPISLNNVAQLHEVAQGRRGWISEVKWSPNGRALAVASAQGITLHDAATLNVLAVLDGHTGPVKSVAINRDGTMVVSGSADTTVRLWNLRANGQQTILKGHTDLVDAVALSRDGKWVVSGGADRIVRIWDAVSGHTATILHGHTEEVSSVVYLTPKTSSANEGEPTGQVASASWDNTIRLWDAASGGCQAVLAHDDWVRHISVSRDGEMLVSSSRDMSVRIWDVASGKERMLIQAHIGGADCAVFSPDGTLLASSGRDKAVKFWNAANGKLLHSIQVHSKPVLTLAFSPDGTRLATGSGDNTVRIWQV